MSRTLAVTLTMSDEVHRALTQIRGSDTPEALAEVIQVAIDDYVMDLWMEQMPAEEKAALRASLEATQAEMEAGGGRDVDDVFDEVLADLDRRHPEAAE